MSAPLTKTQAANLKFIKEFVKFNDRFPTVTEHCLGRIVGRQILPIKNSRQTAQFHRENLIIAKKIKRSVCDVTQRTYFELIT